MRIVTKDRPTDAVLSVTIVVQKSVDIYIVPELRENTG